VPSQALPNLSRFIPPIHPSVLLSTHPSAVSSEHPPGYRSRLRAESSPAILSECRSGVHPIASPEVPSVVASGVIPNVPSQKLRIDLPNLSPQIPAAMSSDEGWTETDRSSPRACALDSLKLGPMLGQAGMRLSGSSGVEFRHWPSGRAAIGG